MIELRDTHDRAQQLMEEQPEPGPEVLRLAELRQELEAVGWSHKAWLERARLVANLAEHLPLDARWPWLSGLRILWQRQGWAMPDKARHVLLDLLAQWADWTLLNVIASATKLDAYAALLQCEALIRLGAINEAHELLLHWQLACPRDKRFVQAWLRLLDLAHFYQRFPIIDGYDHGAEDLRLVPLAHHHSTDFAWQYGDPDIPAMCCLPTFSSDDEWHAWLDEIYADEEELPLGIWHSQYGLIGCCHLEIREDLGFLYYWLGVDFRGQGLALRANRLLLKVAQEKFAMTSCYAKAYLHNQTSRRLLSRLNFLELDILPAEHIAPESFHRFGNPSDQFQIVNELNRLKLSMGNASRIASLA